METRLRLLPSQRGKHSNDGNHVSKIPRKLEPPIQRNFAEEALFSLGTNKERPMTSKTIALVMAFVLSSTMALAQSSQGKAGSDNGPTSNAPTTSGNMNQDTTVRVAKKSKTTKMQKSTTGSSKDASTQGGGTAGAAQKKGDATTPGGTMKQ